MYYNWRVITNNHHQVPTPGPYPKSLLRFLNQKRGCSFHITLKGPSPCYLVQHTEPLLRTCFYLENKILKLKCLRTTTILSSDIVYQTFLHSFLRESKSSLIITCKTTNSLSLLTQQQYAKTFPLTFLPQHSAIQHELKVWRVTVNLLIDTGFSLSRKGS